jgi:DNA-binding NtrC family response regulator
MAQAFRAHRVLIVEDEYYLAADLELALQSEGAEIVGLVGELSEALGEVAKANFDAVVLDINLRDEYAYCLADELKMRHIPFVFATGYAAEAIPQRFSDVKRFEKPYDVARIARHVVQLCESRAAVSG